MKPSHRKRRRHTACDRYRTAIHEAGHAIMASHLGARLVRVSVFLQPDHDGLTGLTRCDFGPCEGGKRNAVARALTGVSGDAAVDLLLGRDDWETRSLDVLSTSIELLLAFGDFWEEVLDECYRQARRFLKKNWPFVEAVAAAALRQGKLNGEQFRGVLRAAEGRWGRVRGL